MKEHFLPLLFAVLVAIFLLNTANYGPNVTLFFSLMAIYLSVFELHRDSITLVKIKRCDSTFYIASTTENQGKPFIDFRIIIENRGVKLIDAAICLTFGASSGHGTVNVPLLEFNEHHGKHEYFERGMLAFYGWKSYHFHPGEEKIFCDIYDCRKQNVRLELFSQSYLAKEFRIGGFPDKVKRQWNILAGCVNSWFQWYRTNSDGSKVLVSRPILPQMVVLEDYIIHFVSHLRNPPTMPAGLAPFTIP